MYGTINFARINTDPGADSAFAPPAGWQGNYIQYMRDRWKDDFGVRQHVAVVGRMLAREEQVEFCGRFADEARRIADATWKHYAPQA